METVIQVKVIDKHAIVVGEPVIVCGNSGYFVEFDFDEEWEGQEARTARFAYVRRGAVQYQDRVFTGNRVEVPVLTSVAQVRVGVFAGNLCTTTPAVVPCEYSIRCNTGAPEDPTPDQYDQIMELLRLNSAVTSVNGQTGDVKTRLMVTITANEDGTYTSSHTSQEIYAASQAGAVVEASNANGARYSLYLCSEQFVQFLVMSVSGGSGKRSLNVKTFVINGDKVINANTQTPIHEAPSNMVGATDTAAGTAGLVPAPAAGDGGKFLRGDGTWGEIAIPEGGGGVEEAWELLADVTFEEEVKGYDVSFDKPQKKLRVIVDSLAADADTNFSGFTLHFNNEAGSTYYPNQLYYPIAIPRKTAGVSVYDISTYYLNETPCIEVCSMFQDDLRYGTNNLPPKRFYTENLAEAYFGKLMVPEIVRIVQSTYAVFAAGTRYRIYGVRA